MWSTLICEHAVVVWLMILFLGSTCRGEDDSSLFSTTSKMQTLVKIEDMMMTEAMNYLTNEQNRLAEIRRLIKQILKERGSASRDPQRYLSHPVQSLQLIRRFRRQWEGVRQAVSSEKNKIVYEKNVAVLEGTPSYPSEGDYSNAVEAILRLQDTYKITASQIAQGEVSKRQPKSPPLIAEDCYEIGITAWNTSSPECVRQWMGESLHRLRHGDAAHAHYVNEIDVLKHIAMTFEEEGVHKKALEYTNQILEIDPNNKEALRKRSVYENRIKQPIDPHEDDHYKALCRGDEQYMKTKWPKFPHSGLYCRLAHYNRPRLIIRPAKEEIVFRKPKIVIYHDILTDVETERLIKMAEPRLQRSKVVSRKQNTAAARNRLSSVAWLDLHRLEGTDHILQRVEDYTGLSMKEDHHEHLQVANYGLGGYYTYHYDDLSDEDLDGYEGMGKRIATLLFYLNDVEEGGATVFTKNGVRIAPTKNSAVFWYNYLKNGERDLSSMHAGCPVLMGTKWAANLWILDFGQIFRRKCGLSQEDIFFS